MDKSRLNLVRVYKDRCGDFYDNEERAGSYNHDRYDRSYAIICYIAEPGVYVCYSDNGVGVSKRPELATQWFNKDFLANNPDLIGHKHVVYREEYFAHPDCFNNGDLVMGYLHIFIKRDLSDEE